MAYLQVVDGGESPQSWVVAAGVLNGKSRTANKGGPPFRVSGLTTSRNKTCRLRNVNGWRSDWSGYFNTLVKVNKCLFVILTYLLTPWSRVVLEKLTGLQLVKKFPAFYGTRRFITAFTSVRHLSLSLASTIESIPLHPTC
jgi:hypothetical protein